MSRRPGIMHDYLRARASASTQFAEYEQHCRARGLPMADLVDR